MSYVKWNETLSCIQTDFVHLLQKRFLISSPLESDTHDYKWWIPITFTKPGGDFNNTYSKVWMKDSERVKVINGLPNKNEAAIFNVQQTGKCLFFKTNRLILGKNM